MFYTTYSPAPQLRACVSWYRILRADKNPFDDPELLIADGSIEMIFNLLERSSPRDAVRGLDLSKGTVRFTADGPLPDAALEQLVRHGMHEIDGG